MDGKKWVDDMAVSYEVSREDLFSDGGCIIAVPLEQLTGRRAEVSSQGTYELVEQPGPTTVGCDTRQGKKLDKENFWSEFSGLHNVFSIIDSCGFSWRARMLRTRS